MAFSEKWRDSLYAETYEIEIRGLKLRRAADQRCTAEDIEGALKHLYIMDGADWGGRGPVQDTSLAATIAAYEHFIENWRSELK